MTDSLLNTFGTFSTHYFLIFVFFSSSLYSYKLYLTETDITILMGILDGNHRRMYHHYILRVRDYLTPEWAMEKKVQYNSSGKSEGPNSIPVLDTAHIQRRNIQK